MLKIERVMHLWSLNQALAQLGQTCWIYLKYFEISLQNRAWWTILDLEIMLSLSTLKDKFSYLEIFLSVELQNDL